MQIGEKLEKQVKYPTKITISECAPGFELVSGDIGGRGPLGYFENVQTGEDCAKKCLSKNGCLSYEWSPSRKACNLNDKPNPNRPQYRDFKFCRKGTL